MDQPFETLRDARKGAEWHGPRHDRVDVGPDGEPLGHLCPWILLELLDRRGDALAVGIDPPHEHAALVAYRVQGRGVHGLVPRDLGTMDQAVRDADVNEQTEAGDLGHRAVEHTRTGGARDVPHLWL